MCQTGVLSCEAKLASIVLDNRGPLTPLELAAEGRLTQTEALDALGELESLGLARTVCGLCETREEVYELVDDEPESNTSED